MGIVNFSIPKDIVLDIIKEITIDNFIETGTFKGETTFWASDYFPQVYTIEISREISNETAQRSKKKNITFIVGDSKDELPKLVPTLKGRSFFWLDGHWCTGGGGKDTECPLIDELESISMCKDSVIFIDDARCFLGPLPAPHDSEKWPKIDSVFAKCKELFPTHFTTIIDDVIMCIPQDLKLVIDNYWRNTFNERFYKKEVAETDIYRPSLLERILRKIWLKVRANKAEPPISEAELDRCRKQAKIDEFVRKHQWLTKKNIKSVIDIGANVGQFALNIRALLPDAAIYSFEAIPSVYEDLLQNFSSDEKFKAYNVGLGNEQGKTTFYVNNFSDSSSFLKMTDTHKDNFPITSHGEKTIEIIIDKLDNILSVKDLEQPYLVKLDVQGFEKEVILGGSNIIKNADYVISEVSFVELYEKQILFDTIYKMMKEFGFEYVGNFDQLASYVNGEIMQADAIFRRKK